MNSRTVNGSHPTGGKGNNQYLRKGIELRMTRKEYYDWCDTQHVKILGFYENGETPSIDRKDSHGHYEIENLQIISFIENRVRGEEALRIRYSKPVVATSTDRTEVLKFDSILSATKSGFNSRWAILDAIKGDRQDYKGFTWKYDRKDEGARGWIRQRQ